MLQVFWFMHTDFINILIFKENYSLKKDIFDRIMELPVLNLFNSVYKKNKEIILYLFFGGLTFVIGVSTFGLFNIFFKINEHISNVFSWIIAVTFAFFTNRLWVFDSKTKSFDKFITQMLYFYGGRIVTLVDEELILLIFITWIRFPSMIVKIIAQIIVIILNYIISKLFVFKKQKIKICKE